jgi:hypothetical protein
LHFMNDLLWVTVQFTSMRINCHWEADMWTSCAGD